MSGDGGRGKNRRGEATNLVSDRVMPFRNTSGW